MSAQSYSNNKPPSPQAFRFLRGCVEKQPMINPNINSPINSILFNPFIYSSSICKTILKNEIPKENISDNSGLNSPVPNPF